MDTVSTVNRICALLKSAEPATLRSALAHCESLLAAANVSNRALYPLAAALRALAARAAQQNEHRVAGRALELSLRIDPDQQQAWLNLGGLLLIEQRYSEALETLGQAAARYPGNAEISYRRGVALHQSGFVDDALPHYRAALGKDSDHTEARVALGTALAARGDYEHSAQLLREALAAQPDNPSAIIAHADISLQAGRTGTDLSALQRVATGQFLPAYLRARACFVLGHTHDRRTDFDTAFDWFAHGNRLMFRGFDLERFAQQVDTLCELFAPGYRDRLSSSGLADRTPVFVIGMPRSGTTLVEQILASHSQVYGAGELEDINDIARALGSNRQAYPGCLAQTGRQELLAGAERYLKRIRSLDGHAARIVDKMPRNFMHAGLITRLFPHARIVVCSRDPRDTCLSCYFQLFAGGHPYSYDLATLGHFHRHYERLVRHWRSVLGDALFEVRYEDLVGDQEAVSRRLLAFCGLEWETACLRFHETQRSVGTSSRDQVRKPIYSSSTGRWKNYRRHLAPLLAALAATD